jgi:hypothetical protein
MGALSQSENEIERLWNVSYGFYWDLVAIVFIETGSSTIRERIWTFMKCFLSIIFAPSRDGIYWMWAFPRSENELDRLRHVSCRFYWQIFVMTFIGEMFLYDKRRYLTVYERLPVDFIGEESWWHLLKRSFSTIIKRSWPFTNGSLSILFHRIVMTFFEVELFNDKRMNMAVYERLTVDFIGT